MPVDRGGCGYLRVRQPLKMVKAYTEHDTHVVDTKDDDYVAVAKALSIADIALVRQGGEEGVRDMRQIPELKRPKWVLDIDDNIEEINPYSEHYREYGTEEVIDRATIKGYLWQDGVRDFSLDANRARVASLLFGMQEADLVTVTTPALADYARQYNANVAVLPNCLDTSVWWKLPLKPNKTLRVGWSGGVSHYEDWYTIKEPLNALMRKHRFTLVSVGAHFPGIVDEDLRDLVEVWPWVSFEAHSYRMMALNLDIALIPLADLAFNRYKSAVKWYEFSAMGVPSVVAGLTPYREEVEHGTTAMSYQSPQGFYESLEALIKNASLREKLGNNARSWVVANRDAKQNASLWPEAYQSILT